MLALKTTPTWAVATANFAVVVVGTVWVVGCQNAHSTEAPPVVVLVSGDTHGWIVPCGCTSNQSGGLLRRGSYVEKLASESQVVLLDAGGAPAGSAPYQREKFEAIVQGELLMGLAAHNIGAAEAELGAEYLRELAQRLEAPLVSANARDRTGQPIVPAVKLVPVEGSRPLAVVGVLSPSLDHGLRVEDPEESILTALESVAGKYEYAVVLAYLPSEELRALAERLPEVDVIIGGPTGQAIPPQRHGPTLLASATNKGKFLAELRPPQQPGSGWSGQIVEMDESLADAAEQEENLEVFYALLGERDYAASETGLAVDWSLDLPEGYQAAGSAACQECHSLDYDSWEYSTHAHAWGTLEAEGAHVDSYCQQCHTTSFGLPGGFVSVQRSPARVDVGCESCHGPSQAHVDDPRIRTPFAAADQCIRCHDRENSPEFDYDAYWPQIEHGEPADVSPVAKAASGTL